MKPKMCLCWCSQGLLVMTDPDTPFLHVGMNAPRADREEGWIQRR